jgi:hypothetical protein
MVQEAKDRTRKMILAILVISLFLVTIIQLAPLSSTNPTQSNNGGSTSSGNNQPGTSSDLAPGGTRPITEFATGTRSYTGILLPSSPNDYLNLSTGWVGNAAKVSVSNLWESSNQAQNGTFPTGSGTGVGAKSSPWVYSQINPSTGATGGWYTANKTVYLTMPVTSGGTQFNSGERLSWNETTLPAMGTVLSAYLVFSWYPIILDVFNRSEFICYATINNTGASSLNYPWFTTFATIYKNASMDSHWNTATVTLSPSMFNLPSKKIDIEIGMQYTSSTATYTGWTSENKLSISNVQLVLQAYVMPHQVNLKVRPQGYGNTTISDGAAWGSGSAALTSFTTSGTGFPFIFSSGNLTSNAKWVTNPITNTAGIINTVMALNATRSATAAATFVYSGSGSKVNWTLSFYTSLNSYNQSVGTTYVTYYAKYYFNVSAPSDWNYTKCTDPSGKVHNPVTETNNFTIIVAGSNKILRVNATRIGSYTSSPSYNPYLIYTQSNNYVKKVFTQISKTGAAPWTNQTKFYPGNYTRFAAYIPQATGGLANLTISGPATYGASPSVLKTITGQAVSNGYANFTVLVNSTNGAAGSYTGEVDWVYTTIGEAGSLTCSLSVFHKFNLTITYPATGNVVTAGTFINSPPTSVTVKDYYTGVSMSATVMGKTSYESKSTAWPTFQSSGTTGLYTNVTDVWSSLAGQNSIWIAANCSDAFYDMGLANNTLYIGVSTQCYYFGSIYNYHQWTVYYTENTAWSISGAYIYEYGNGSGISGGSVTLLTGISTNNSQIQWSVRTSYASTTNSSGMVQVTIAMYLSSCGAIPKGTYNVWFQISKTTPSKYQTQTFEVILTVEPQSTQLNVWNGNNQYVWWGNTAMVQVNFTTLDAGSGEWKEPFANAPIRNDSGYAPPEPLSSFVTASFGTYNWTYGWSVKNDSTWGVYDFYFNTALFPNPTPSGTQVSIDVILHKANYANPQQQPITLYIKSHTTSITGAVNQTNGVLLTTNSTSVYPGDLKTIFVWYNDTHTGVSTGVPVAGTSVTYTSTGNLFGNGSLTPVTGRVGLYSLTLSGALTYQRPGIYELNMTASNSPDYVSQKVVITLTVTPIPCTLTPKSTPASFYYNSQITYLLYFNDTHNNRPITAANFTVNVPPGIYYYSPIGQVSGSPGLWNLTLILPVSVGSYKINITATNVYYAGSTVHLQVNVINIPTALSFYTISYGVTYVQANATVRQASSVTIYLWFNDTRHNVGIGGVASSITYSSTEFGSGGVSAVTGTPGLYNVTFSTPDLGTFTVSFTASVTGYQVQQSVPFTVKVILFPAVLAPYTVISGVKYFEANATVHQGNSVTIYIWFNDTRDHVPIAGVASSITYSSTEFGSGGVSAVTGTPGLYNVTFTGTTNGLFNVTFTASVAGYQTPQVIFSLDVYSYTSSLTLYTLFGGVKYVQLNATSQQGGDVTLYLWYNATSGSQLGGIPNAQNSITFSSAYSVFGSGFVSNVTGEPGLYYHTFYTPSLGTYYVTFTASETGYQAQFVTFTVNVIQYPAVLTSYTLISGIKYVEANASVHQTGSLTIYIWFNNTYRGSNAGIGGAAGSISYSSPSGSGFGSGFVSNVTGEPGLYYVTLSAPNSGVFNVTFTATITGYQTAQIIFNINVYRWKTIFESYVVSGGVAHVQSNCTVSLGSYVTIYIWFNDTTNGVPITGAARSITYTSSYSGWKAGWVSPVAGRGGLYNATFQAASAGTFTINFVANVTGYQIQTLTFTVNVPAPPQGFSIVMLAIVGVGGGGIVVLAAAAMIFIRRARMPFVIKKINETLALISKGQHEQATPVPLKSRDEIVTGIMGERVESFTKRKPSKEEEAGAPVKEEVIPAPTAETSAALKEELKAVGEEKPEEGIEEVEMNTLDEQLQQLEKVESKENLPDGAKEVRDVIEKYKEGKKKKET